MPKIYRDEEGNLIKEGSRGCTDCGLPANNVQVLESINKEETFDPVEEENDDD